MEDSASVDYEQIKNLYVGMASGILASAIVLFIDVLLHSEVQNFTILYMGIVAFGAFMLAIRADSKAKKQEVL
ncbi:hypothetical protein RE474_09710 [Methanolobus sediminis]|uniref:Uncharacterized protein n=1 Tax=Methanolobus sediminis TaxID=3072978 RepID=A0AA51ULU2_9EURY|nr:hypothetical protein [Methanolobus sediminis]WMW24365.1 hypothetical protein RE474_09710 [Methanolobus sediminis]